MLTFKQIKKLNTMEKESAVKVLKKKVATEVMELGDCVNVYYHDTRIVGLFPSLIRLDNGGWSTKTTKKRMNEVLELYGINLYVYQKKFQWFITDGNTTQSFIENRYCEIKRA
jgi:hypothetical protein